MSKESSGVVWVDSDSKSDEEKRALKRKQQYYYLSLRVSAIETLVNTTTIVAMLLAQTWRRCYKKMPTQTPMDIPNQSDEMPIAIARLQQIQKNMETVDRYMVLVKEQKVAVDVRKRQCSRQPRPQQQQQKEEREERHSYSQLISSSAALDYQKLLVERPVKQKVKTLSYDCLVLHPKSLYDDPQQKNQAEKQKGRESLSERIRYLVERYRIEEERMAKLATYIALMTREIDELQSKTDHNSVSQCVRSTLPFYDAPYRSVVNQYDQVAAELDKRLSAETEKP